MAHIRAATSLDIADIRKVHLCAFSEGEKQKVSALAVNLLSEETNPSTLSLVAEADGVVVGHVAFSPVTINNKSWLGYILAPLGVKPEYQKRQIGSNLVKSGIERLSQVGVDAVFVYGDPHYYGKFGFNSDIASKYSSPYELQYPFGWQAIALSENILTSKPIKLSCVAPLSDPELW
ncbi:acetyltransferase, GNAT family [Synechococcus sp. PCC 7335]|uniref:GNAT family N-acetyltransferase n=1 Tax=Synechococcus sp. (strain ATCC 29403 / PCC 7335) TaxID=91464 RepID=UPI00017EB52C|nr:N-acetyltransferase [Synechococcus sp. PCC 7335]EDX82961.1 acetyltransferase, GNAT family [Synechococcus sp. PCC 7335]